jgi:hypothetical protein
MSTCVNGRHFAVSVDNIPAKTSEQAVVGQPLTLNASLTAIGSPWRGPVPDEAVSSGGPESYQPIRASTEMRCSVGQTHRWPGS